MDGEQAPSDVCYQGHLIARVLGVDFKTSEEQRFRIVLKKIDEGLTLPSNKIDRNIKDPPKVD